MDQDKDGKLTKDEIKKGYELHVDKVLTMAEIDEIYDHIDINGSGSISYTEFMCASIEKEDLLTE